MKNKADLLLRPLLLLVLASSFLFLRFYNLGELEVFTDEAGNILTSIDADTNQQIDPIGLGRPLLSSLFKAANLNLTYALELARASVGVISILSLVLLYCLAKSLFNNRRLALIACSFWVFSTYQVAHDRLALQDPFSTCFLLLSANLIIWSIENSSPHKQIKPYFLMLLAGVSFGLAFLNKISAVSATIWIIASTWIYLKQTKTKVSNKNLAFFCLAFLSGILLLLATQDRVLELGSKVAKMQHVPALSLMLSAPLTMIEIYFDSMQRILKTYQECFLGYAGYSFCALLIYLITQTLLKRNSIGLILLAVAILYVFINSAMYGSAVFARYFHNESVFWYLFIAYASCQLLRASFIQRSILYCLLAATLIESSVTNFLVLKDARSSNLSLRSSDYQQYTKGHWSGLGLVQLDQELQAILRRDSNAMIIHTTIFNTEGMGLRFYYYGSPTQARLLPLEVGSDRAAAGLAAYYKKFPEANFYLVITTENQTGQPTPRILKILHQNLQAELTFLKNVNRSPDLKSIFEIYRLDHSKYDLYQQKPVFYNRLPVVASNAFILTTEVLKKCPLQDIKISSSIPGQKLRFVNSTGLDKLLYLDTKSIRLENSGFSSKDFPLGIYADSWELDFLPGGYDKQRIKSVILSCDQKK
jgi:hypothetical protein